MQTKITAERLRELLSYDPLSGVFTWRVKTNKSRNWVGKQAGCADRKTGYIMIGVEGCRIRGHRLAWLYMTGQFPDHEIDHVNTIKGDNRWINLRAADPVINGQNKRKANSNSQVGMLGVSRHRGRFMARIKVAGKHNYLGTFDTPELAHLSYVEAKRQLHAGGTL